ncbi:MAG: phosphoglycerate kinase [Patescibacteria group bacterium]
MSFQDFNFLGKKVLLRCDLNVPLDDQGNILDDFRLQRALPTIFFLRKAGAIIILLSHLGEPQGIKNKRKRKKQLTLKPIGQRLSELLREKVLFSKKNKGRSVRRLIQKMKPGEILLLENLRFDQGEEQNSLKFAQQLARLGDVFVNEAFSVCHRAHASVAALPQALPCLVGPELFKEFNFLSQILQKPPRPLVVIIGGNKTQSKLKVIKRFLDLADYLLLAGESANLVLAAKGLWPSHPLLPAEDMAMLQDIKLTDPKIYLPLDVLVSSEPNGGGIIRQTGPAGARRDEDIFDIGPETISVYQEIIGQAQTVFWAGPVGLFEVKAFSHGTRAIASAIAQSQAQLKLAGGGETVAALRKFNLTDDFSFISTGGGAMLSFLAGEKLPGLEALGLL